MLNIISGLMENWVPKSMITEELHGIYGNRVLANMAKILEYYKIYECGADFPPPSTADYGTAKMHYKKIKALIDKEARFMFSKPAEITLQPVELNDKNVKICSNYQSYINNIMQENNISGVNVKAAKDYLISGRIAMFINFDSASGIKISFVPALEFIYDTDEYGTLTKIIAFYAENNESDKADQRIHRKKYWIKNGKCHISEGIYDGTGRLTETITNDLTTEFEYIPAAVILNSALLGDTEGVSEINGLTEYEEYYSRLSNLDIDSLRQSMNPIRYAIDINSNDIKNLKNNAGAFWDLHGDGNSAVDNPNGRVGMLECSMRYSSALNSTLERIRDTMYEQVEVPALTPADMKGLVTSGKALKNLYYGLIVRCDEKWLDWKKAFEFMAKCLIDGAKLYPDIAKKYCEIPLQGDFKYKINVTNQYPLPEDEETEKAVDISEVNSKVRSIKSYMKKWHGLTDNEADKEIQQIAMERQILEDTAFMPDTFSKASDDE